MNKDTIINILLEVVDTHIAEQSPIQVTETFHRLTEELGYTAIDAKKMIASCLSMTMNNTLEMEVPFDSNKYISLLDQLPQLVLGQ